MLAGPGRERVTGCARVSHGRESEPETDSLGIMSDRLAAETAIATRTALGPAGADQRGGARQWDADRRSGPRTACRPDGATAARPPRNSNHRPSLVPESAPRDTVSKPILAPGSHVLVRWLRKDSRENVGCHTLLTLSECPNPPAPVMADLRELAQTHYVDPQTAANRLASHGWEKTADLLRAQLPTNPRSRSGELGEILATEMAELQLGYTVPIRRLRWKDGRNMALRGDDLIGVIDDAEGVRLLKGEAKSRARLDGTVLAEAQKALDANSGHPTEVSLLFLAARLDELSRNELARKLERALLNSFRQVPIEHLLFVLAGNPPRSLLRSHLNQRVNKQLRTHGIAVYLADHQTFIRRFFSEY